MVTVGVPLLALGGVLGVQITDARNAGAKAGSALQISEVFRSAAGLQASIIQPELIHSGLQGGSLPGLTVPENVVVAASFGGTAEQTQGAQQDFDVVLARHAGVLPAFFIAAFQAQERALTPVLGGDSSSGRVAALKKARTVADDALTDLFLRSQGTPWFIYQDVVEVNRSVFNEWGALLTTLVGRGIATPADLASLAGARRNSVNRAGMGTDSQNRSAVRQLMGGPLFANYEQTVALAERIAAGRAPVAKDRDVATAFSNALALLQAMDVIIERLQDQARAAIVVDVGSAKHRQQTDLILAAAVLAITLLMAAVALRSILSPLRDLTRRAGELAAGRLDGEPVALIGRDELTRLAAALEGNAATLLHVNAQARAMADGRLDDPSLARSTPGPFGEVLHSNVIAVQAQAARLRHDADHDPLTGLLNRMALERAVIPTARIAGSEFAHPEAGPQRWLFFLDLDGFKGINDEYGHEQGDDVLRAVSERLLRAVRPGDLVARLGGDEFVVVMTLEATAPPSEVDATTERLAVAVRTPVPRRRSDDQPDVAAGQTVQVGVSIGRARVTSLGNLEGALAIADAEMYVVKRATHAEQERRAGAQDRRTGAAGRREPDEVLDLTAGPGGR
jgi:diguanylate cyclase (GGDEF)-like protein